MQTTEQPTHQSRWGFHPCDHETFRDLKEFHKLLLRDLRATRRYERWSAKLPHNRVRRTYGPGRILLKTEPTPEPKCVGTERDVYLWVLAEYRNARKPQATLEAVAPLDLPAKWRTSLEKLTAFYAE